MRGAEPPPAPDSDLSETGPAAPEHFEPPDSGAAAPEAFEPSGAEAGAPGDFDLSGTEAGAPPDAAGEGSAAALAEGPPPADAGELGYDSLVEPDATSQMVFVDVIIVLPSSNPVVVLQEAESPYRELRIPIGGPEGIAIGYAARRIATPRPLTHELMTLLLREFDLTLDVVRITGCFGGSFTAEIVVSGPLAVRTIDCRPSDAIALALRQNLPVPIVAAAHVLDQVGSGAAGSN